MADDDDTRREFHRLTELFRERVPGDNPLFTISDAISQSWSEGYLRSKQALEAMQWLHTQAQIEGFFEQDVLDDEGNTAEEVARWDDFASRVHAPTELAQAITIVVNGRETTMIEIGANNVVHWTQYHCGRPLPQTSSGTGDGLGRTLAHILAFWDGPTSHTQTELAIEELCYSLLGFMGTSPGPALARARLRQARWNRELERRRAARDLLKREAAGEKPD